MHDPASYDTRPLPPGPPRKGPAPGFAHDGQAQHWREWEAHVDAGRIGTRPEMPAHILENIRHNERVLKRVFPVRG